MSADVTRLVKQAAEAAKHAPKHLQEAAFHKAFEALVRAEQADTERPSPTKVRSRAATPRNRQPTDDPSSDHSLDQLDRTAHADINHNETVLVNCLRLLRAAKDDLGIDGLTASQIAKVLVEKFRCSVARQSVGRALNSAGRYVNRHTDGNLVVFKIMAPGDQYLSTLGSVGEDTGAVAVKKKTKSKRRAKKAPTSRAKTASSKQTGKKKASRRAVGPATAMSQLYDEKFYSSPRTIAATINKLKHDLGRTFKPNELSPVLLRWLRSGKLSRSKNSDNQYEYKAP